MNQAQEIIVYRNPGEKAVWDAIMDGPGFFYVIVFLFVMGIGFAISNRVLGGPVRRLVGYQNEGWVHLTVGSILGALAVWFVYV